MPFAFRIPMTNEEHIHAALRLGRIPVYNAHVATPIRYAIRCIHGIDRVMKNTPSIELEVYVGRASTVGRVMKRWREHGDNRGHRWAAILFMATRGHSRVLEKVSIRSLQKLKDRNRLCIGNANIIGGATGPDVDVEHEFIYMTWGHRTDWFSCEVKPSIKDLQDVARDVALDMKGLVTTQQVENGLRVAGAPLTQYEKLEWYDHE